MATQIQLRRGTYSLWQSSNPILAEGEIGIETDTKLFKIGDGTTNWNSLLYSSCSYAYTSSYSLNAGSSLTTGSTYPITSSWSNNSISSSYSQTSSFALNAGSNLITASTYPITSSWALNAISSSYSDTSSYSLNAGSSLTTGSTYPITSSWSNNSISASYIQSSDLSASYATTSSYASTASITVVSYNFTKGGAIYNTNGIPNVAQNYMIWRAPYSCSCTQFNAYYSGSGTGVSVNARKNGIGSILTSSALISTIDTWTTFTSIQSSSFNPGDKLEIQLINVTGSVQNIVVQLDFIR